LVAFGRHDAFLFGVKSVWELNRYHAVYGVRVVSRHCGVSAAVFGMLGLNPHGYDNVFLWRFDPSAGKINKRVRFCLDRFRMKTTNVYPCVPRRTL